VEGRRGAMQVPEERKRWRSSSAPMTSTVAMAPDGELPSSFSPCFSFSGLVWTERGHRVAVGGWKEPALSAPPPLYNRRRP
jgi:hypothetical protein